MSSIMSISLDIIIVLLLIISVYAGYKRGLIDVGFKLVAIIISILASLILYSPVTYFIINNTDVDEKIEEIIVKNGIVNAEKGNEESNELNQLIQSYAKDLALETQNAMVQASAKPIAVKVIGIIVMIAIFILTKIILFVLKTFTNIITKLPILKQCNEIAGLAYGLLRGFVIIYFILAIVFFVTTMIGSTIVNSVINESYVTKFLYNNNLMLQITNFKVYSNHKAMLTNY